MPFFQDADGGLNGWQCACHLTGPHISQLPPFPSAFDTRYRNEGACSTRKQCQAIATMTAAQLAGFFGLDASHRAKENRTHRTHWPAADFLRVSRVRSGYAVLARYVSRAIPGPTKNARRMRGEDGP